MTDIQTCPVCRNVVTWDAKALVWTGRRLIKEHRDGISRPCIATGQPIQICGAA